MKRIHVDKGYVILEKAGIPIAGMMPIDEFEDYLELRDRKVQAHVKRSSRDYKAGRTQPVQALIDDLRGRSPRKRTRRTA